MNTAPARFPQHLVEQVRQNPGRAGLLAVLLLVMGVLWTRALLSGRGAAVPAAAEASGVSQLSPAGPPARQIPEATRRLQEWLRTPLVSASRNLFAIKLDYFPRAVAAAPQQSATPPATGFWDQLAKSMASRADEQRARRILVDNLKAAAAKLDLQSTMLGGNVPRALINGTIVGEGDVVEGFRILKIEARRVIVEREGVKFEVLFSVSR